VFCKNKSRENYFSVASGGPQPASALCGRLCTNLLENIDNVLTAMRHIGLQLCLHFAINDGLLGFW
jgi:hypothetical protein